MKKIEEEEEEEKKGDEPQRRYLLPTIPPVGSRFLPRPPELRRWRRLRFGPLCLGVMSMKCPKECQARSKGETRSVKRAYNKHENERKIKKAYQSLKQTSDPR